MSYESPTIRPPSEWRSGLLRVTRGCNWNRCRFCGIYPHLGQSDFSVRSLSDILEDIHTLRQRRREAETIFLGDADPLAAGVEHILAVLEAVRDHLDPARITSYARCSTLYRLGAENIAILAAAGLNRIHMGLESGDDETLLKQRKGQNGKMVKTVGSWLKESGIELSVYVLLGLGGTERWRQHATETALLLNAIEPAFIRIRRLFVYPPSPYATPGCPLNEEIDAGEFQEQTPEGTVRELELLLDTLQPIPSFFTCDHRNNYLNVAGYLNQDREDMLEEVREFLRQPLQLRERRYRETGSGI